MVTQQVSCFVRIALVSEQFDVRLVITARMHDQFSLRLLCQYGKTLA